MRAFTLRRLSVPVLAAAAAVAAGCGGGGSGEEPRSAAGTPIVTHSPDSEAPPNAPAHWLPPEAWVYDHWLPFDETRLYALLHITRRELWAQLRDDRRNVAQLAARHGWPDPHKLAAALVAPQRPRVGPERAALLERRALRLLTQGHLAQHAFFHSLHQFAIPSAAPELFGVTDAEFRALRRSELSPLAIARLHGRSPGQVEAGAIAVLRERVAAGVEGDAMPAAQGRRLLRRQLSQLPRWLDQARYNGPPTTTGGALTAVPRDYASNPSISGDGRSVAYEAYRQKLPLAVKFGEIAVLRADLDSGPPTRSTRISPLGRGGPVSAYNSAISGDGRRVTFESAAGNDNFAKRYGRIAVLLAGDDGLRSLDRRATGTEDSQSAWNPALSGDGRRAAYLAVRDGRTVVIVQDLPGGRPRIVVRGAPVGGAGFGDPYEPALSRDGTKLVFTWATGRIADERTATSQVRVLDLGTGRTVVASRADGAGGETGQGFSADAAISPDGRWVAFTTQAPNLGASPEHPRLLLRDLDDDRTVVVPTDGERVLDPVISRDARVVAWTAIRGMTGRVLAWTRGTAEPALVSAATGSGGAAADGDASDPTISDDGRRIAFASTAANLGRPEAGDTSRAIFVRDLRARTTRMVSDTAAAYPPAALAQAIAKLKAAGPPAPAAVRALQRPSLHAGEVAVTDNAFFAGADRPTIRIQAGDQVTWDFVSRQSHAVAVQSGPERFATPARNGAQLTKTFTKPGTYQIVCELHAPGMRMTVVVD